MQPSRGSTSTTPGPRRTASPAVELVVVLAHPWTTDAHRPRAVHGTGRTGDPVHRVIDADAHALVVPDAGNAMPGRVGDRDSGADLDQVAAGPDDAARLAFIT